MIKRCYASHKAFPGYFSKNCRLDSHKDKHRVTLFTSLKKKNTKKLEHWELFKNFVLSLDFTYGKVLAYCKKSKF